MRYEGISSPFFLTWHWTLIRVWGHHTCGTKEVEASSKKKYFSLYYTRNLFQSYNVQSHVREHLVHVHVLKQWVSAHRHQNYYFLQLLPEASTHISFILISGFWLDYLLYDMIYYPISSFDNYSDNFRKIITMQHVTIYFKPINILNEKKFIS